MFARPEAKAPEAQAQVAAAPAKPTHSEPIPAPQEKPKPGKLYEWDGDGRQISRIVIDTNEQKARFYSGEEQVGWTTVASGVPSHPTPTGSFEVLEKVANKKSNLYGKIYGSGGQVLRSDAKAGVHPVPEGARFEGAKMPYYLRITYDGVGLHAGPIPRPGRPASHGCIRLPAKLAPVLFSHVGVGTQVSIVGSGPDYGQYAQRQRAEAAARLAQAKARKEAEAEALAEGAATGARDDTAGQDVALSSPPSTLARSGSIAGGIAQTPAAEPSRTASEPARAPARPKPNASRPARHPTDSAAQTTTVAATAPAQPQAPGESAPAAEASPPTAEPRNDATPPPVAGAEPPASQEVQVQRPSIAAAQAQSAPTAAAQAAPQPAAEPKPAAEPTPKSEPPPTAQSAPATPAPAPAAEPAHEPPAQAPAAAPAQASTPPQGTPG